MSKKINYLAPECTLIDVRVEGLLCVSTFMFDASSEKSTETFEELSKFEW